MQEGKSGIIVLSGVSIALIIISLYLGTVINNNKLFFVAFATYIGALPYIRGNIKNGITAYFASAVLSVILIPNKLYAGVYIALGIYPLIKLFSERRKIFYEYFIKYLWFNISITLIYFLYRSFIFLGEFLTKLKGIIIFIIIIEILFFVYDYIFTRFIMFMEDRILKQR